MFKSELQQSFDSLEQSEAYEILDNYRRRAILRYLKEANRDEVSLKGMRRQLGSFEEDKPADQLSDDVLQRMKVATYYHVPKLDEAGVVDYDTDAMIFSPGENFEEFSSRVGDRIMTENLFVERSSSGLRDAFRNIS